jgi:hypothetical protein
MYGTEISDAMIVFGGTISPPLVSGTSNPFTRSHVYAVVSVEFPFPS